MQYQIFDNHGFAHETIDVQPETLTKEEVEEAFRKFIKVRGIKNIVDFDIRGFQQFLLYKYDAGSRSTRPHPLTLQV